MDKMTKASRAKKREMRWKEEGAQDGQNGKKSNRKREKGWGWVIVYEGGVTKDKQTVREGKK